jgi:hypothetical protein
MYSPNWGRFLQPDPIGYAGGNNLYAYVQNDPLDRIDPFGTCDNPQGCGGSNILMAGGIAAPGLGAGDILVGGAAAAGAASTVIGTAGIGAVACILLCPSQIGPEPPILQNEQAPPEPSTTSQTPEVPLPNGLVAS